jgi:hypothetical protein
LRFRAGGGEGVRKKFARQAHKSKSAAPRRRMTPCCARLK